MHNESSQACTCGTWLCGCEHTLHLPARITVDALGCAQSSCAVILCHGWSAGRLPDHSTVCFTRRSIAEAQYLEEQARRLLSSARSDQIAAQVRRWGTLPSSQKCSQGSCMQPARSRIMSCLEPGPTTAAMRHSRHVTHNPCWVQLHAACTPAPGAAGGCSGVHPAAGCPGEAGHELAWRSGPWCTSFKGHGALLSGVGCKHVHVHVDCTSPLHPSRSCTGYSQLLLTVLGAAEAQGHGASDNERQCNFPRWPSLCCAGSCSCPTAVKMASLMRSVAFGTTPMRGMRTAAPRAAGRPQDRTGQQLRGRGLD